MRHYRSMAATVLYLGQGMLPQACFVVSNMQQKLGLLKVWDLVTANERVTELQKLQPLVSFCSPRNIRNVTVTTKIDTFHCDSKETYGQTGFVTGLKNDLENGSVFHGIRLSFLKQQKTCYSSFWADILAAADGDDRCYTAKTTLLALFSKCNIKH